MDFGARKSMKILCLEYPAFSEIQTMGSFKKKSVHNIESRTSSVRVCMKLLRNYKMFVMFST
jgi:hypothetical protein